MTVVWAASPENRSQIAAGSWLSTEGSIANSDSQKALTSLSKTDSAATETTQKALTSLAFAQRDILTRFARSDRAR